MNSTVYWIERPHTGGSGESRTGTINEAPWSGRLRSAEAAVAAIRSEDGPCDVPNVVVITRPSGTEWLGNIAEVEQYHSLLEWAVRCRDAGEMLALPLEFHGCRISPFLHEDFDRSHGAAR
jgi:hypothetical protein